MPHVAHLKDRGQMILAIEGQRIVVPEAEAHDLAQQILDAIEGHDGKSPVPWLKEILHEHELAGRISDANALRGEIERVTLRYRLRRLVKRHSNLYRTMELRVAQARLAQAERDRAMLVGAIRPIESGKTYCNGCQDITECVRVADETLMIGGRPLTGKRWKCLNCNRTHSWGPLVVVRESA